jgi:flagellar P-ring protein precursor FlgI
VGGFTAEGKSATKVTKGVPTSGKISNGAIIEKEVGFELANLNKIHLSLRNPDFTTAKRLGEVINRSIAQGVAHAMDSSTVLVTLPAKYAGNMVGFITDIEQLSIQPDTVAKIIIDDQDGVIVMGENVRISTVAVTHGSITIRVTETPQVSQPNPFTQVQTATVVDRSDIKVREDKGKFAVMESGVTLQQLVNGLNALGATPRDLITILRSIKAAGALQADIEVI